MKQDLYAFADSAADDDVLSNAAIFFAENGNCSRAVKLADKIDSAYEKRWFFYLATEAAAEEADSRWLDTLLTWGLHTAQTIRPSIYRGDILEGTAQYVRSLEETERGESLLTSAIQAAGSLESYYDRARVLGQAAESRLFFGDTARCVTLLKETLTNVAEFYEHYEDELDLIVGYTRGTPVREFFYASGILCRAAATALKLDDSDLVDSLLSAVMYVGRNDRVPYPFATDAERVFESLMRLIDMSDNMARADDHMKLLSERAMEAISSGYSFDLLDSLAAEIVSRDGTAGLNSFLTAALDRSDSLGDMPENVLLLSAIPRVAAQLNDPERIHSLMARTYRNVDKLHDPLFRSWAFERLASALINLDMDASAESLLFSAIAVSDSLIELDDRADLLESVFYTSGRLERSPSADSIFSVAAGRVITIFMSRCNISEMQDMADMILDRGDTAWADSVTRSAIAAMHTCPSGSVKGHCLNEITATIVKFDDPRRRESLFHSLYEAIPRVADLEGRSTRSMSMAETLIEGGMIAQADSVLRLAIKVAKKIDSAEVKADAVSGIAAKAVMIPDSQEVKSLLALVSREAEQITVPRYQVAALADIAGSAFESGYLKDGEALLSSAMHIAEAVNLTDTAERCPVGIDNIVQIVTDRCDAELSDSILTEWLAAAEKIDTTDQYRISILRCLYETSGGSSLCQSKEGLIPMLVRELENSRDASGSAGILIELAFDRFYDEDTASAMAFFERAMSTVKRIPSDEDRSYLAGSLAYLAASMGRIQTAYGAVQSIDSPRYRVRPLLSALKGFSVLEKRRGSGNEK